MKRIVFFTFAIWWAIFSYGISAAAQPAEISLRIIGMNDFHGALTETESYAGAAKLATAVEQLKAEADGEVLILASGDMMQGTAESNLERGQTVIRVMNHLGVDAMTVGNHEFDWGLDVLAERVREMNFPCLGANVKERDTGRVVSFLKPYTIAVYDGMKVGIIGTVTQDTITSVSPKHIESLQIDEPSGVVREAVRKLKEEGVDIIVLLAHMACYQNEETGQLAGEAVPLAKIDGVNVIVSGHSHTIVCGEEGNVPIMQAGDKGRYLDVIDLVYSTERKTVVSYQTRVEAIKGDEVTADDKARDIIIKASRRVEKMRQQEIGYLPAVLFHDRRAVSPLGSWIADGILMAAGTDIALQNGGGIRRDSLGRRVTEGDLYEMLPFDNTIYTAHLTGAEIKEVLEHGLFDEKHSILQFAGMTVVYDPNGSQGDRILAIQLADHRPLMMNETYTVAYNDFMALGGDGYPYLKEADELMDTGIDLRGAIRTYLKQDGGRNMPQKRLYDMTNEQAA